MPPAATPIRTCSYHVRRLLNCKQAGFSGVLESALMLAELELWPPQMPRETSATTAHDR
jgi:hypothetical protein